MTVNELMIYISESRYMQFVEEDAAEALDDLMCSRPDLEELLSDRARTDLVDIYKSRIIPIYVAVMMRQIIRHTGYSSLSGADAEDKLEAAYDAINEGMGRSDQQEYLRQLDRDAGPLYGRP